MKELPRENAMYATSWASPSLGPPPGHTRRRPRKARPCLEQLESRCVPAVLTRVNFNGSGPNSLIEDGSGDLIGATRNGVIFELTAGGTHVITLANLAGSESAEPFGNLTEDSSGNLFGIAGNA